jgi:hypothetical protein
VARITTVTPETADASMRGVLDTVREEYGYVPGIAQVLLVDPAVAWPVNALYDYLNLRPDSPFTRLQREMLGTVVNGLVGGAP